MIKPKKVCHSKKESLISKRQVLIIHKKLNSSLLNSDFDQISFYYFFLLKQNNLIQCFSTFYGLWLPFRNTQTCVTTSSTQ